MIRETTYDAVFDAQTHFRLIMDSMARPGKLNVLNGIAIDPPESLNPAAAFIGLALLNGDVSFYAAHNPNAIADYFISNTATQPAPADEADFLFLAGTDSPDALIDAKIGTLTYPDTSATAIIAVTAIHPEPQTGVLPELALTVQGPGVNGQKTVYVQGLNPNLLTALRHKNAEYPLGIDAILTDPQGRICCLPRSNQFVVHRSSLPDGE